MSYFDDAANDIMRKVYQCRELQVWQLLERNLPNLERDIQCVMAALEARGWSIAIITHPDGKMEALLYAGEGPQIGDHYEDNLIDRQELFVPFHPRQPVNPFWN